VVRLTAAGLSRRRTIVRAVVTVFALGLVLGWLPTTDAWAVTNGEARIVALDGVTPLNSGGSETMFDVALPRGAHCAHDTEHFGYHVWSYMVPKGTDPTSVRFIGLVPTPGLGFVGGGQLLAAANTAVDSGDIVLPPLSFAMWDSTFVLPHGARTETWEAGLACIDNHNRLSQYWNVEVRFSASTSDPQGVTWTVAQPLTKPLANNGSRDWGKVLLAVGIVVISAGAVKMVWPKRTRQSSRPTEARLEQEE
jgi:hypothetical protein